MTFIGLHGIMHVYQKIELHEPSCSVEGEEFLGHLRDYQCEEKMVILC
jgi:hypothetical protein